MPGPAGVTPAVVALALALLSSCSSDDGSPDPAPVVTRDEVCLEVNAGIAAFNQGDVDETVSRFEAAVPLARQADESTGTADSQDLLDATVYYAELAPEDYLAAAAVSPEFARFKQVTLGQCAPDPMAPDDGSVEA